MMYRSNPTSCIRTVLSVHSAKIRTSLSTSAFRPHPRTQRDHSFKLSSLLVAQRSSFPVPSSSFNQVRFLSLSAVRFQDPAKEAVHEASGTSVHPSPAAPAAPEATVTSEATSAAVGTKEEIVLDFLPEKPQPLGSEALEYIGTDPPLEALGLGSWWPPGRAQYFLDFLHSTLDLHWCGAIFVVTVCLRLLTFPLVVMSQKNVARLNNHSPKMQALQERMSDARRRGDMYDSAVAGAELQKFMSEKNINPLKNMIPIMGQLPIFMSMFIGLRGMATLPLESFMNGGMLWFPDLTVPDPYYGLPALTSMTLYLQFKFAADGAGLDNPNSGPMARLIMKVMPMVLFPLTMNFPAAVTFYWLSTNMISVVQARIVRSEAIRGYLGIPKFIKFNKTKGPKNKGIVATFRETVDNFKVQSNIIDRRRYDEDVFRQVGGSKPKRTFRFDPTKPVSMKGKPK